MYAVIAYTHLSVLVTMRLLCRKGTSSDLKRKVLLRHFTYLVIYDCYFIFGVFFALGVVDVRRDGKYSLVNGLGIFLGLIRFLEPFVFSTFRQEMTTLCSGKHPKKMKYSAQALCSFANSAMNIEYVYLILVGVNQFMQTISEADQQGIMGNEIKIKKSQKTTLIELKYIKLANLEQFDVDRKTSQAVNEDEEPQPDESQRQDQRRRVLSENMLIPYKELSR